MARRADAFGMPRHVDVIVLNRGLDESAHRNVVERRGDRPRAVLRRQCHASQNAVREDARRGGPLGERGPGGIGGVGAVPGRKDIALADQTAAYGGVGGKIARRRLEIHGVGAIGGAVDHAAAAGESGPAGARRLAQEHDHRGVRMRREAEHDARLGEVPDGRVFTRLHQRGNRGDDLAVSDLGEKVEAAAVRCVPDVLPRRGDRDRKLAIDRVGDERASRGDRGVLALVRGECDAPAFR